MSLPSRYLSTTPGSFDHPPASTLSDPATTRPEPHTGQDVSQRLRSLQRTIRGERLRARHVRELSDARRRRRALTPPTMPSGDGSPARRMRNMLRHVQNRAQDDQRAEDTSAPTAWAGNLTPWISTSGLGRMSRVPASRMPRSTRNDLDETMDVFRNLESRIQSTRPTFSPHQSLPSVHGAEPVASPSDLGPASMDSYEPLDRLAQINEDARSLLAQPLPYEDLTRQRLAEDDGSGHRRKRRRVDSVSSQKAYYPITYGNEGQVVSGKLNMQLVSSDGGIVSSSVTNSNNNNSRRSNPRPGMDDNEYTPTNVLRDDASVYCTRSSHCNMVFQHQGQTAFTLEKLIIKAPKVGYTDPVQEGLVFTALHQDDIFEATKRYHIWHYPTSRFGHLFRSQRPHRAHAPLGRRLTHSTPPPISHVRAERQLDADNGNDPSHNDNLSDASSGSLLTPEMLSYLAHGPGRDDLDHVEMNSTTLELDELTRRGNMAAAARRLAEPSQSRLPYNTHTRANEMERPRSLNSPSLFERVSHIDAAFDRLNSTDIGSMAATRPHGNHMPADVAAVLREFESASVQLEDLRQSLQTGNDVHPNTQAGPLPRLPQPHAIDATQSDDSPDRFRRQLSRATQRAVDGQPTHTHATGSRAELLGPDARFSMRRYSSSRLPASVERTSWFTRAEPRIAHRVLPFNYDKFRPRSVDMVDEHMSRPTQGLGSVLKSEMNSNGERIDYVHVRTTQIVQKDNEMTISFDPPVSAKLILLKLWNPKACGDVDGKHNIDIESIQAIGWAGPRWFPAVGMR